MNIDDNYSSLAHLLPGIYACYYWVSLVLQHDLLGNTDMILYYNKYILIQITACRSCDFGSTVYDSRRPHTLIFIAATMAEAGKVWSAYVEVDDTYSVSLVRGRCKVGCLLLSVLPCTRAWW